MLVVWDLLACAFSKPPGNLREYCTVIQHKVYGLSHVAVQFCGTFVRLELLTEPGEFDDGPLGVSAGLLR